MVLSANLTVRISQVAHNRIWMFEPVDVTDPDADDEETAAPPTYHDATKDTATKDAAAKHNAANDKAPPPGPGGRYSEITEHFYTIQHVGTGKYMGSPADGKVTAGGSDSAVSPSITSYITLCTLVSYSARSVVHSVPQYLCRNASELLLRL